jgi:hypothetical protein
MKVVLTESQVKTLLREEVIMESFFRDGMSFNDILETVKMLARKGVLTTALVATIAYHFGLNQGQRQMLQQQVPETEVVSQEEETPKTKDELLANPPGEWTPIANDVLATVYNAVPSQCNNDVVHTASMFKLNLNDVLSHRIIAMERTMMKDYGLKYGDVVCISGVGKTKNGTDLNGLWRIEDTMNKRFAGQHKIDILVPNDTTLGKWTNVVISVPKDDTTEAEAKQILGM